MQIKHKIDAFLSIVFPELGGQPDDAQVIKVLSDYYCYGPYKPKVVIKDGFAIADIDTIKTQGPLYKKVLELVAGAHGIDPNKDGYKLANVPGKRFGGSQLLAWCYVSWAMGMPEMLASLQLPFDNEYEVAQKMQYGK